MKRIIKLVVIFVLFLCASFSYGQIEIILRKSFVDSLKNKVTISADYEIAFTHKYPNAPSKDGDIHIAGKVSGVGLPVVAEIMNAKKQPSALQIIHQNEGNGKTVNMIGVWRLWCEHAANGEIQEQGADVIINNTNPPHVFEIHPVLKVNEIDLIESLKPIIGFQYKNSDDAFFKYSNTICKIEDLNDKIKITTNGVGYNYAEFWIEVMDDTQFVVDDGRFVFCTVLNQNIELICNKMRMVFPKGSQAEKKVTKLKKGAVMHVVGIPRMDLALVSYRIEHSSKKPEILNWNLPVEMIIVAILQ